jgi:predicted restriction endonuclease
VTLGKTGQKVAAFQRMKAGDVVLFSANRQIFASAVVTFTARSREIADYVWGQESPGVSFELLYFLEDVDTSRTIAATDLNRVVPYDANYNIQGFSVLNTTQSENVLTAFPFLTRPTLITAEKYRAAVDALQTVRSLDRKVEALARIEQSYLRQLLFREHITARCAMCGEEYPVDLLVAGHIKRRSACSDEERKDAHHVVMPICKLGCDELFERGYISVDGTGQVVSSTSADTQSLAERLMSLRGRVCRSFRESTRGYFSWHFENAFLGK